jgi:hypothetical protein
VFVYFRQTYVPEDRKMDGLAKSAQLDMPSGNSGEEGNASAPDEVL